MIVGDAVCVLESYPGPYKGRRGQIVKVDSGRTNSLRVQFDDSEAAWFPPEAVESVSQDGNGLSQSQRLTLDKVPDVERESVLAVSKFRVIDKESNWIGMPVVVVDTDALAHTASVRLEVGGSAVRSVAWKHLEVVSSSSANVAGTVAAAREVAAAAKFKPNDYVSILRTCPTPHPGVHLVREWRGETNGVDHYLIGIQHHGDIVVSETFLVAAKPCVAERPSTALAVPTHRPNGQPYTPGQIAAFKSILEQRSNIELSGPPGSGKTEVYCVGVSVIQAAKEVVLVATLSNEIVVHSHKQLKRHGVINAEAICGTYTKKFWATLGEEWSWDNVPKIVAEITTSPKCRTVCNDIRQASVIVFEEDENTLPHFKDILLTVISRVCGYTGPEPGANKQYIFVRDQRQLGGIEVVDGNGRNVNNVGLLPGGVMAGGGQAKESLCFESQSTQKFYPGQPVTVSPRHFGDDGRSPEEGTVLRYCSLRSKFLVNMPSARQEGLRGFGSEELVKVEYVCGAHLQARSGQEANFEDHHLSGTHRVAFAPYDENRRPADQDANALWHRCMDLMHRGDTDNVYTRELFARLQDVGTRFFDEVSGRPDWYETTKFGFLLNKSLEEFATREHVAKYRVEERWSTIDGAGVVHSHYATKVDENGVPIPVGAQDWDGPSGDLSGGRQFVAGAVALYLQWKVGYPLKVGTMMCAKMFTPHGENTAVKIPVGKGKQHGYLKPGTRIHPIGTVPWPHPIGGEMYEALVVECPEYVEEGAIDYPQAVIPPLFYESVVINGEVLRWVQWPVKYAMLSTGHALTGQAAKKLVFRLEFFWCHDAAFSLLTRAAFPPPPCGTNLAGLEGAVGITVLNNANGRFFDPSYVALGLHPKVAILFADKYGKDVPEERLRSAREWIEKHNAHHLKMEEFAISRARARERQRQQAGPSRSYDE